MRVFSAIRPSGDLHIGNYFGAIRQWVELQKTHDCVFSIVDLHAITTPYQSENLQKNILELTIALFAAGLDPENASSLSNRRSRNIQNWLGFWGHLPPWEN